MTKDIRADIDVASGRIPADVVMKNGQILDVFTGRILVGDIAIRCDRIVGIGMGSKNPYRGHLDIDLEERIVVPGLIDAHVHIESSMLGASGFATLTVPRGTTTVIADPHEIANVCGADGIRWLLESSQSLPQSIFVMLPSCVPATPYEDAGAVLEAKDLAEFLEHPRVLGLGEVMDYPGVIAARENLVEKIALVREMNKRIDGHAPGVQGRDLGAYAVAGIGSDHECSNLEEMIERLQLGIRILIREGTAAKDLAALIPGVNSSIARRCAFCTDDKLPGDILNEGHIDFNIRSAIGHGLDPVEAVRLATLNGAEAFGLCDRGALVPGRRADLVILDGALSDFRVSEVYYGGKKVAENGHLLNIVPKVDDSSVRNTVRLVSLNSHNLKVQLKSEKARVISMKEGSLVTGNEIVRVSVDSQGCFVPESSGGFLKIVLVERHKGSGLIGLGILKGYELSNGAIASSIAHDSHNLIAVGDDDEAILTSLRILAKEGGGISLAAKGGTSLGVLPLPLGGLMTDEDGIKTAENTEKLIKKAQECLGIPRGIDPFMPLSFLALPVIPDLKITARGLFDVKKFEFVPVAVE